MSNGKERKNIESDLGKSATSFIGRFGTIWPK
jgi:hypothetical protein